MVEISHFYITTKSKVGVEFDVPHDVAQRGTSNSTPTLFIIIETLYETKWEHWSTTYTYLAYETFAMQYFNIETLKH